MTSYRVDLQPRGASTLAAAAERARTTAGRIAGEGVAPCWVRSGYSRGDSACFLVFEGASPEAVGDLARCAGLEVIRIDEWRGHER